MQKRSSVSIFRQILSSLLWGTSILLSILLLWIVGIDLMYSNRILPGVTLNNISLGGLTEKEAVQLISANYSYPQAGRIVIQYETQSWTVSPAQLGVYMDTETTAQNALRFGKTNPAEGLIAVLFGYKITPVFIFDERVALDYLTQLSAIVDQPIKEASLSISNAQVTIKQGQPGRVVDVSTSLQTLADQIEKMQDGVVTLTVTEVQPKVLDVSQQGEQLKSILSQPFTLSLPPDAGQPAAGPWAISTADLASMLTIEQSDQSDQTSKLSLAVNQPLMQAYLKTLDKEIDQNPQNARFTFNDDTRQLELIKSAVIGRKVDIQQSAQAINDAIVKGDHSAVLTLETTQPQVTDQTTAAQLGITQLVGTYTSYFRGSSSDRVQNITTGAASFHGLLVAPGATLSMADILGDISLDNGYAEAPIIIGDQSIQGVGGGICQVSTTLFRTAFFAGYPIVERHAHTYRVGYYEQTASGHDASLAGMDATVFVPIVDFKFTNDTSYWLLMETYINTTNDSLTWKFYSTSDGRNVDWSTSGLTNVVPHPDAEYIENSDLSAGTIKQTDYAVDGATVEVDRTVSRNGQVLYNDKFVTKYVAWPDIYEYGPGTSGIPTPTPNP